MSSKSPAKTSDSHVQQQSKPRTKWIKRRALVYDSTAGSYTIKTDDRIREADYDAYWAFYLGPCPKTRSDSWDLFLDCEKDKAQAVEPNNPPEDCVFVTGLHLNQLGSWGKFLRKTGVLDGGYILRP
ncbi:hypothetical protein F4780DRAFT_758382 [Xylariomycetidae sp. FL0641]|nr:hypothetical protein F4780DRAFT_758382 [Xylariomycetidae sp. FL0641]